MARSSVTRVKVSRQLVQHASRVQAVRTALHTQAALIASRARQIDSSEGGKSVIKIVDGIRPGGRAYSNVESNNVAGEYGTSKTARRRTLGRAADIQG